MTIHLGYVRAGWAGLVVGGCCFILPPMLIVLALRALRCPAAGDLADLWHQAALGLAPLMALPLAAPAGVAAGGGWTGALLATVGIFLPSFVFVALSGPVVPYVRRSPWAAAFLDGVNVAAPSA